MGGRSLADLISTLPDDAAFVAGFDLRDREVQAIGASLGELRKMFAPDTCPDRSSYALLGGRFEAPANLRIWKIGTQTRDEARACMNDTFSRSFGIRTQLEGDMLVSRSEGSIEHTVWIDPRVTFAVADQTARTREQVFALAAPRPGRGPRANPTLRALIDEVSDAPAWIAWIPGTDDVDALAGALHGREVHLHGFGEPDAVVEQAKWLLAIYSFEIARVERISAREVRAVAHHSQAR